MANAMSMDIAFAGKMNFGQKGNPRGSIAFGDDQISYLLTPFACVEGAVQSLPFRQVPEKKEPED